MTATCINPTGRKTEARIVEVRGNEYFFSYQTCIGFRGERADNGEWVNVRVANEWGPTTGKHFQELGIDGWAEVTMAELQAMTG